MYNMRFTRHNEKIIKLVQLIDVGAKSSRYTCSTNTYLKSNDRGLMIFVLRSSVVEFTVVIC